VPPTVETSNLTKRFGRGSVVARLAARSARRGELVALDDVTFTLEAGDVAALVGRNGAGKSTLLRVLATLLLPTSGHARIAGHDIARDGVEARGQLALVSGDDRSFSLRLTGQENLRFFAGLYGVARAEIDTTVERALGQVDLLDVASTVYAAYSSGMRQRLALARALLLQPAVLLLDEPFRALDTASAERLRGLVAGLSACDGVTVLVATHDLTELDGVWTRVIALDHGAVAYDGPRARYLAPSLAEVHP
jgi:ABC-2 type transport system ATP-binding protein